MLSTREWAAERGLWVEDQVPPVEGYDQPPRRKAEEVAVRAIVLHCVAAVGYGVGSDAVVEWLEDQGIWKDVSPAEQALLRSGRLSKAERDAACWRQEAQWALLWAIDKVGALGLPTGACDTAMLVDHIMPGLGDPIEAFVSSANLRDPSELLAEDDRVYNLHCYATRAAREGELPGDFLFAVLVQRRYAFEWLNGDDAWDAVEMDT